MTLDEIKALDKQYLLPKDVAPILGCHPYSINIQARDKPEALGFPVIRIGSRVKIPRKPFLRYFGEE